VNSAKDTTSKNTTTVDRKMMTIEQLIEKLCQYPKSWEVVTEGCDCHGDSHDVVTNEEYFKDGIYSESNVKATYVIITRSE
jgi:hypothetical protein